MNDFDPFSVTIYTLWLVLIILGIGFVITGNNLLTDYQIIEQPKN